MNEHVGKSENYLFLLNLLIRINIGNLQQSG